jgi:hypothetical protein
MGANNHHSNVLSVSCDKQPDPLGKYYGSLLYGAIGLTMLFPGQIARDMISVAFVSVSVASLSSRLVLFRQRAALAIHPVGKAASTAAINFNKSQPLNQKRRMKLRKNS